MPIVDVEVVSESPAEFRGLSVVSLADAVGRALGSEPGRTWVRLRRLDAACYAENRAPARPDPLPVFVTVMHAHPPEGSLLDQEVAAVTAAVARSTSRPAERVHVQYAPEGAGRQAFGGRFVR